jgi:hypothetical protein
VNYTRFMNDKLNELNPEKIVKFMKIVPVIFLLLSPLLCVLLDILEVTGFFRAQRIDLMLSLILPDG